MADVLGYLKHTKNSLIGNPSAKLALKRSPGPDGPLLPSIVSYVNYTPIVDDQLGASSSSNLNDNNNTTDSTTAQIRTEAANVVASLAHGPREVLFGLLEADAPDTILTALAALTQNDPPSLRIAIVRALRALFVAIADCAGPSLWDLGEECLEYRSETRLALDYIFQTQALDVYLPLLDSPTISSIKLYIAQLLAFAVRIPKHRIAVTDWLPPPERAKESKGKRGWENSALVDANSPSRQGGWVMRQLAGMLKCRDFGLQEVALYAIAALVKDNPSIALVLSKTTAEQKASQSVLSIASELTKDRKSEIRLAACLCVTNILRSTNSNHDRRLSSTIIHVLSAIISNTNESAINRAKACHILSWLVADDTDRCIDAWKSGTLVKLADVVKAITPTTKPQEWDDGEAIDTSRLREAALTAIASISMLDSDIRNEVAGVLDLLPLISVCCSHPTSAGVRYAACQCIRALSRAIRVLRTSLLDAGVGLTVCEIVERQEEDRRVTNVALAGLCNLLNDFSPLRQTIIERGMVARISELARAQEDALRVSALWAIKNLLNKANSEEKQAVMKHFGWDYLRSCLVDTKEDVQEQALNIVGNIASTPEDIFLLLDNIQNEELLKILADALESPSEDVVCQAIKVLNNISNDALQSLSISSNLRILSSLRTSLLHHRPEIQHAAIGCVELLARAHPGKMREFGMDEALRHLVREVHGLVLPPPMGPAVGVGMGGGIEGVTGAGGRRMGLSVGGTTGMGGLGVGGAGAAVGSDGGAELREMVGSALRAMDRFRESVWNV